MGKSVKKYDREVRQDGKWEPGESVDTTTTIGYKRSVRFPAMKAEKIHIKFQDSKGPLCINNVEAYMAPALVSEPRIRRNGKDEVMMIPGDKLPEMQYTTDGSTPTKETPV